MEYSKKNNSTSGLSLLLFVLLLQYFRVLDGYGLLPVIILVLVILKPEVFTRLDPLFNGITKWGAKIVNPILLGTIFFGVLLPIAWLRRLLGSKMLPVTFLENKKHSAFVVREYEFSQSDLNHPF
jgi:hypothetical protein